MPSKTQQSIYALENISIPQHVLISIIWIAFEQIHFSIPTNRWITPAQFYRPDFPALQVWRPNPHGKLELLAGFRTYNLAKATGIKEIACIDHTELSEVGAVNIAISDILQPLLMWSHGSKSSNKQIAEFCKTVRQNLPEPYKKQWPRQSELCQWLNIGKYINRKQSVTTSKIAQLRQALSSAAADVNNEESGHHGEN